MSNNLVSIIAPLYNVESYVEQFILSILNQTYKHFELIIIDDGSTDNSYNICKCYADKDERIKLFTQNNSGVSIARNFGLDHAKGKWVSFIDPDDYVEFNFLEVLIKNFTDNEKIDVVECYYEQFTDSGDIVSYTPYYSSNCIEQSKNWIRKTLFCLSRGFILPRTVLYRRECIESSAIRFNSKYSLCEDVDFVLRVMNNVRNVFIETKKIYFYRRRQFSLSNIKGISDQRFSALLFYKRLIDIEYSDSKNSIKLLLFNVLKQIIGEELVLKQQYKKQNRLKDRISLVENKVNQLFSEEEQKEFNRNPLFFLKKRIVSVGDEINWKDNISIKYYIFYLFLKLTPYLLFEKIFLWIQIFMNRTKGIKIK